MEVIISTITWLVVTMLMAVAYDFAAYRSKRRGWDRVVFVFLLTCSQIVITEFVLGAFTALNRPWLIALNVVLSGIIIWLTGRTHEPRSLYAKYRRSLSQSTLNVLPVLTVAPKKIGWQNALLALLASITLGWVIFIGVLFPVIDWDGNSYHMTFIGNVIQNQGFYDTPTSIPWLTGYPKAGEFLQLWNVLLPGHDAFVDLSQLPFLFLAIGSLYTVSRNLGISRRSALFTSLLFLFTPIVINELKTTYVDVMLGSLFFTIFAVATKKSLGRLDYLLIGIMYSLIIGLKATGLLLVLVTIPFVLWHLIKSHNSKTASANRQSLLKLTLLASPMLFGLYWYIKNLLLYGSPIYPFGFKLMGHRIFAGKTFEEYAATAVSAPGNLLPTGYWEKIWFVWTEQEKWSGCLYNYDSNYSGLGPLWFIIMIPVIIGAIFLAFKYRRYVFIGIIASVVAAYIVYPANFYPRYTFFILLVGILSLGFVLDYCSRLARSIIHAIALSLSVFVLFTTFTLCYFPPQAIADEITSYRNGDSHGLMYKSLPGNAFIVAENLSQEGDTVAYDSKPYFIYPLWRRDFKNNVVYVPLKDEKTWRQDLTNSSVDYLFTFKKSPENIVAHSLNLKKVYEDAQYEIFSLK